MDTFALSDGRIGILRLLCNEVRMLSETALISRVDSLLVIVNAQLVSAGIKRPQFRR